MSINDREVGQRMRSCRQKLGISVSKAAFASQRMFTDLEQLQVGDKFYISVLDETLAYEVDQTSC